MGRQLTLVFAEDDSAVPGIADEALAARGFTVLAAADGHEALPLLAAYPVDLLLADIVMPGRTAGTQGEADASWSQGALHHRLRATGGGARCERFGRLLFKPVRHRELTREVEALLAGG